VSVDAARPLREGYTNSSMRALLAISVSCGFADGRRQRLLAGASVDEVDLFLVNAQELAEDCYRGRKAVNRNHQIHHGAGRRPRAHCQLRVGGMVGISAAETTINPPK
jgi:hypothetical protein